MNAMKRFLKISTIGFIALVFIGMVLGAFTQSPQKEIDLTIENMWVIRVAIYIALILGWPLIAKFATRVDYDRFTFEEAEILKSKQPESYRLLKAQQWKVALFIVFFEIAVVQQFWFIGA